MKAEDIVQETWVVVVEKLPDFAWRSSLRTWITGILINQVRSHKRRSKENGDLTGLEIFDDPENKHQIAIDLQDAITKLPPGYREVIIMHDLEGFKHREIADVLHISEGTSKSQLFQARKFMRTLLSGYTQKPIDRK